MDIGHLEELRVFTKYLNYSRAARELFISQPALSQHIARMENELGFALFTHDGPVEPTTAGSLFCAEISSILAEYHDLVEQCAKVARDEQGLLRVVNQRMIIGAFDDLAQAIDEAWSHDGPSRHSMLLVPWDRKRNCSEFDLIDSGAADVSFTFVPFEDVGWLERCCGLDLSAYGHAALRPEPLVVMASPMHPLADRASVSLLDLRGYPIIENNWSFYERCDRAIRARLESEGIVGPFVKGMGNSKLDLPQLSPKYLAFFLETALRTQESVGVKSLVRLRFDGEGLAIRPHAIWRLDNPRASDIERVARRAQQA